VSNVTATYSGDDLQIVFSGVDSYGDDGSLGNIEDIAIESATLCGVELDLKTLPGDLILAMMDCADNLEWN
jgi:hypothetical protein